MYPYLRNQPTKGPDWDQEVVRGPRNPRFEYSPFDHKVLRFALGILRFPNLILEIGVTRTRAQMPSTDTLLSSRPHGCAHVGVDIVDNYIELDRADTYFHHGSSEEHDEVLEFIFASVGHTTIDFLHIDGCHSPRMAFNDWEYTAHVPPGGVIVIHDTAVHNGPTQLVNLIDRSRVQVFKFGEDRADDWGITVCQKL